MLAAFVRERFGISLARYSEATVGSLVASLPEHELGAEAICRILSACCIGETMFMRHPEQLAALAALVPSLPSSLRRRPLRVWSAGCASGEEAYSLAAMLGGPAWYGVSVLGTDLNPAAIERAKAGRYRLWSMRGVVPADVEHWLDIGPLEVVVRDHLRPYVDFRIHNLMTDDYPADLDVVVCRNVLLYFDEAAAADVMRRFAKSLEPGGVLVTGFFDPEPPHDGCFVHERANAMRIYRRVGKLADSTVEAEHRPHDVSGEPHDAPPPSSRRPVDIESLLSLARDLSDEGRGDEALSVLDRLAERFPLRVEVHVLSSMIADEAGRTERSLEDARKAVFLMPDLAIGHYLIASSLERLGEQERASVHLAAACKALARLEGPEEPVPFGEGLTASQLRRMIDVRYDAT